MPITDAERLELSNKIRQAEAKLQPGEADYESLKAILGILKLLVGE